MARYSELLGRRIQVTYRAGDNILPATGTIAADSGKSIFLEERFDQHGQVRSFRWEIPYVCIVSLREVPLSAAQSLLADFLSKQQENVPTVDAAPLEWKNRPDPA